MSKPFRVLLCASECAPFAKTGGLADVAYALPKELVKLGVDARVIVPCHRVIKDRYRDKLRHLCSFSAHIGWRDQYVGVETLQQDGVTFYFIDNEFYFGDRIYRGGDSELEQYAFFSRAVLECLPLIDFIPDVLHVNDWHTAIIPMLLKTQYGFRTQFGIKTVLSIHNLAFQGKCGFDRIQDLLGIDSRYYTPEFMEAHGCANVLKAGCVFADALSTVSPSYAKEIQGEYYGEGLDGILRARGHQIHGILNGIDTEMFNPETDPMLPVHYKASAMKGKKEMKKLLCEELGLNVGENTPVVALISRLTKQKGLDLIINRLDSLMQKDMALIILGQGDKQYEDIFRGAEYRYKGKLCAYIAYNEGIAHKVYAGSDFLLMPSAFEPCGLSQMIAQRYGTLPIVRETGGLRDSVQPYNQYTGEGNGFSFSNFNAHEMENTICTALEVYQNKEVYKKLQKNAMKLDLSFAKSAEKYLQMYKNLV